jgi:Fe2+ transport system protein FeoA
MTGGALMPLAMVCPGEDVQLIAIRGGQRIRKRLADLGLNVGMTVRMMQHNHHGPSSAKTSNRRP